MLTVHHIKLPITETDRDRVKQALIPFPYQAVNLFGVHGALVGQAGRQAVCVDGTLNARVAVFRVRLCRRFGVTGFWGLCFFL